MTAKNTAAPAKLPAINGEDIQSQVSDLFHSSVEWLHTHWLQILIAFVVGTGIVLALHAARGLGGRLAGRSSSGKGWAAVFGNAIQKTNTFFIVMLAARLVSGYAGPPAEVAQTIGFLFTIASVFQVAIWAREIILVTAMGLIRLLVTFAVFAIAFIVVLDNLGVNVTGLVAGLGVGGIAIGLAAQGIFADLFAALAIIFDRPFRRGDQISYGDTSGAVEEIGLKSTRIRGLMGEERIISNKNLLDKEIQNNTKRERRRTTFTLGLAYETPVEVLEAFPETVKTIVEAHGFAFVRCGFFQFGASSLDFDIQFDSLSADFAQAFEGRHKVGLAILRTCNEQGIGIPYPTQTTFTAAPDGRLVMPYAEPQHVRVESGNA
jgi:small-conductance mechanosensitive channel